MQTRNRSLPGASFQTSPIFSCASLIQRNLPSPFLRHLQQLSQSTSNTWRPNRDLIATNLPSPSTDHGTRCGTMTRSHPSLLSSKISVFALNIISILPAPTRSSRGSCVVPCSDDAEDLPPSRLDLPPSRLRFILCCLRNLCLLNPKV
jgi:hypothetical protein